MNCPLQNTDTADILLDFCAGKLAVDTAAEFERHLAVCPECRAFTEGQRQVWTELDDWEAAPVSAGFDERLYARIAETDRSRSWRAWLAQHLGWRPAIGAAAACAAVAIGLFVGLPRDKSLTPAVVPSAIAVDNSRVESIDPEQVERALEDLEMLNQLSAATTQDL